MRRGPRAAPSFLLHAADIHAAENTVSDPVLLIAGLGNPGPRYADTRHNAGAWFLDALARRAGVTLGNESRFRCHAARWEQGGERVWLVRPDTWMNESGLAVGALARFYRIPASQVLVAHDELDVPVGDVRLKAGGGSAGHNGIKDVIAHLGSPDFLRLRIGVGRPPAGMRGMSHVLSSPSREEREAILEAIDRATDVMPELIAGDPGRAMTRLHTRPGQPDAGGED